MEAAQLVLYHCDDKNAAQAPLMRLPLRSINRSEQAIGPRSPRYKGISRHSDPQGLILYRGSGDTDNPCL
jgi:hypothetical protein